MPVSASWTNPSAAGTLDLATGAILTETWTDAVASNFLYLGGTTGKVTQQVQTIISGANTTTSAGFVALPSMSISITTTSGPVVAWAMVGVSHNVANGVVQIALQLDGGGYNTIASGSHATAGAVFMLGGMYVFFPTAAAHTINIGWAALTAGTATQYSATYTQLVAIELKR